jgi:four helix bundle protein
MKIHSSRRSLNRGYMKLEVWHDAVDLNRVVWEMLKKGNIELKIRGQIADAAQSAAANIAEGYSRRSINEYIQHLYVALGSLSELLTRCVCLKETGQCSPEDFERIDALQYSVENKAWNLIRGLEGKRAAGTWVDSIEGAEGSRSKP